MRKLLLTTSLFLSFLGMSSIASANRKFRNLDGSDLCKPEMMSAELKAYKEYYQEYYHSVDQIKDVNSVLWSITLNLKYRLFSQYKDNLSPEMRDQLTNEDFDFYASQRPFDILRIGAKSQGDFTLLSQAESYACRYEMLYEIYDSLGKKLEAESLEREADVRLAEEKRKADEEKEAAYLKKVAYDKAFIISATLATFYLTYKLGIRDIFNQ